MPSTLYILVLNGKPSLGFGIPLRPFPGSPIMRRTVISVLLRNLADKRIIRVGICQEGADREQDFGKRQCRRPDCQS